MHAFASPLTYNESSRNLSSVVIALTAMESVANEFPGASPPTPDSLAHASASSLKTRVVSPFDVLRFVDFSILFSHFLIFLLYFLLFLFVQFKFRLL